MRTCSLCGKTLSLYNAGDICFSHFYEEVDVLGMSAGWVMRQEIVEKELCVGCHRKMPTPLHVLDGDY